MKLSLLKRLALCAAGCGTLAAADLSDVETRIAKAVDAGIGSSNLLLEKIVNINSGTLNPAGVRRVADVLRPEFESLGFAVRWIPMEEVRRAGHLVAERKGNNGRRVLLIGHMDTVFEPSSPFQKWERKGDIATGPGSCDMKGGLMVILYALKALRAAGGLDGRTITVFLTGDEEKPGEPLAIARRDLVEAAKNHDVALEFEAGSFTNGHDFATIARRSSSTWQLRATANTGHSAGIFNPSVGSGAVYELARILAAFYDRLQEPDLTFNASLVLGGSAVEYNSKENTGTASGKVNIIPGTAVASGDIRTIGDEQLQRTREKMREIVARHLPGTNASIEFEDGYPSMPATAGNRKLLDLLNAVNRDLGFETMDPLPAARRGAGDLSFAGPYLDALSGLGAVGHGAHAPGETIDLTRQPIQMKRTAVLIYRLTR
jgi:glutamate carboxypeptidase